jgi:hypothetical protein
MMKAFLCRLSAVGMVLALVASSGCGGGTCDVSGVVKLNGKAVGGGQISFKGGKGNKAVGAEINADGTFTVLGAPTGTVKVGVSWRDTDAETQWFRDVSAASKGGADKKGVMPKGNPDQFMKVPAKYGDPEGSGITIDLKSGKNEGVEINLKSGD